MRWGFRGKSGTEGGLRAGAGPQSGVHLVSEWVLESGQVRWERAGVAVGLGPGMGRRPGRFCGPGSAPGAKVSLLTRLIHLRTTECSYFRVFMSDI